MKSRAISAAVATAAVTAAMFGLAAPASAGTISSPCTATTHSSTTDSTISNVSCYRVQAGMERFVDGARVVDYGPTSNGTSSIGWARGTWIRNFARVYPHGGDWQGWQNI